MSGPIQQPRLRQEDSGVYKAAFIPIYHMLCVLFEFLTDRVCPSTVAHPNERPIPKHVQRRGRKCRAGRRKKKSNKRRCKTVTCMHSNFWSQFEEQFSSFCHLRQYGQLSRLYTRLSKVWSHIMTKPTASTVRGETLPVKSKPLAGNGTQKKATTKDSGIGSRASEKLDLPPKEEPVADTVSNGSGRQHQALNDDENRFPPTCVNGAQQIPSGSEQVIGVSLSSLAANSIPPDAVQVTLSSHSSSVDYSSNVHIPALFNEEVPLLNQWVKPFTCQAGDEWHNDTLISTTSPNGVVQVDLYHNQQEEHGQDEYDVLNGVCIPEQATYEETDDDRSEFVGPLIPHHPADSQEDAIPLPPLHTESAPHLRLSDRVETLRPTLEPFSWPPPGFYSFFVA